MQAIKKNKRIDYFVFNKDNTDDFVDWVQQVTNSMPCESIEATLVPRCFFLITDEGRQLIEDGDYVVYDDEKLRVCKPNEFNSEYDVLEDFLDFMTKGI